LNRVKIEKARKLKGAKKNIKITQSKKFKKTKKNKYSLNAIYTRYLLDTHFKN